MAIAIFICLLFAFRGAAPLWSSPCSLGFAAVPTHPPQQTGYTENFLFVKPQPALLTLFLGRKTDAAGWVSGQVT